MKFNQKLWNDSLPHFNAIVEHPFTQQLIDGSLQMEMFNKFIAQDMLYLKHDAEAFQLTSQKADNEHEKAFFQSLATEGIAFEQIMQRELVAEFGFTQATLLEDSFKDYCDHLIHTATHSSYECAASALLPCFWYYAQIGKIKISTADFTNHPYRKWLATYADPFFQNRVNQYITIIDNIGSRVSPPIQQLMSDSFKQSAEFELAVFNYAIK